MTNMITAANENTGRRWRAVIWLVLCCSVVLPLSFMVSMHLFGDCTATRIGTVGVGLFLSVFGVGFFWSLRSVGWSLPSAIILTITLCGFLGLIVGVIWTDLTGTFDARRVARTVADIELIATGIESYRLEHGFLPEHMQDLESYVQDLPLSDDWGSPFQYQVVDDSYTLMSLGACGRPDADAKVAGSPRDDLVFRDGRFVRRPYGLADPRPLP